MPSNRKRENPKTGCRVCANNNDSNSRSKTERTRTRINSIIKIKRNEENYITLLLWDVRNKLADDVVLRGTCETFHYSGSIPHTVAASVGFFFFRVKNGLTSRVAIRCVRRGWRTKCNWRARYQNRMCRLNIVRCARRQRPVKLRRDNEWAKKKQQSVRTSRSNTSNRTVMIWCAPLLMPSQQHTCTRKNSNLPIFVPSLAFFPILIGASSGCYHVHDDDDDVRPMKAIRFVSVALVCLCECTNLMP